MSVVDMSKFENAVSELIRRFQSIGVDLYVMPPTSKGDNVYAVLAFSVEDLIKAWREMSKLPECHFYGEVVPFQGKHMIRLIIKRLCQ